MSKIVNKQVIERLEELFEEAKSGDVKSMHAFIDKSGRIRFLKIGEVSLGDLSLMIGHLEKILEELFPSSSTDREQENE